MEATSLGIARDIKLLRQGSIGLRCLDVFTLRSGHARNANCLLKDNSFPPSPRFQYMWRNLLDNRDWNSLEK